MPADLDAPSPVRRAPMPQYAVSPTPALPRIRGRRERPASLGSHFARILRDGAPLAFADAVTAVGCLAIATLLTSSGSLTGEAALRGALAVVLGMAVFGVYPGVAVNPVVELRRICTSLTAIALLTVVMGPSTALDAQQAQTSSVLTVAVWWLAMLVVLPCVRSVVRGRLARTSWWGERVLIVGAGQMAERIYASLQRNRNHGLRPLGVVDSPSRYWNEMGPGSPAPYLGTLEETPEIARRKRARWAIVATDDPALAAALCEHQGCLSNVPNRLVVGPSGMPTLWTRPCELGGLAAMHFEDRLLQPCCQTAKRALDIALSLLVAPLVVPLLVVFAAFICAVSPGPIFYKQRRIGRGGLRFYAWKLRTMVPNADDVLVEYLESNPEMLEEWRRDHKLRRDPRIIPFIGKLLRKSSLDELPQLWNVLRGEMSLVGPRPIVESERAKYSDVYRHYLRVRPGITGLWQVSGRNNTTYRERTDLDKYYVRNWSPWLDLHILGRTVKTVLFCEGAY